MIGVATLVPRFVMPSSKSDPVDLPVNEPRLMYWNEITRRTRLYDEGVGWYDAPELASTQPTVSLADAVAVVYADVSERLAYQTERGMERDHLDEQVVLAIKARYPEVASNGEE